MPRLCLPNYSFYNEYKYPVIFNKIAIKIKSLNKAR